MAAPLMNRALLVMVLLLAGSALGEESPATQPVGATAPAGDAVAGHRLASDPTLPRSATRVDDEMAAPAPVTEERLVGDYLNFGPGGPAAAWFSAIVVLVLLLRTSPWRTVRNLDALVLAGMCLLIPLRDNTVTGPVEGQVWQPWAYLLLSGACVYWVLRGVWLVRARRVAAHECNVAAGGMVVLVAVGLLFAFQRIGTGPLSAASVDGIRGGLRVVEKGMLPYGIDEGSDGRAPLLYVVHAGALRVFPPAAGTTTSGKSVDWSVSDERAARGVNGLLFVLEFTGLYLLGRRLHSAAIGLTLATVFCLFPATLETLCEPEVMLPAVLGTWALLFSTMGRLGPTLGGAAAVTAGACWPAAWLLVPVVLGSALRRGWHAVGCVFGLLLGAAGQLALIYFHVQAALPREQAAMAAAGLTPGFAARSSSVGLVTLDKLEPAGTPPATLMTRVWRALLDAEAVSVGDRDGAAPGIVVPNGVDAGSIPFRLIRAEGEARGLLNAAYRGALRELPPAARLRVNLRTLLEQVCWPMTVRQPARQGPWEAWRAAASRYEGWLAYGPFATGVVTALVLIVVVLMLATGRGLAREVVGAAMAVCSIGLLATDEGVAGHWAWLLPVILAGLAAHGGEIAAAAGERGAPLPPISRPGPPRISIE